MRRSVLTTSIMLVSLLAAAPVTRADVITDWNATAINVGRAANDPVILRTLAMVHLAMFDALNSIDPRYHAYAVSLPGSGASMDAAAAAAAYGVLLRRFPAQQAALDAALAATLAGVPDGPAEDAGRALGDAVAAAIHQLRWYDGMNPPVNPSYVPGTGPGEYQMTGPVVVNSGAGTYQPFAMTSPSQFRPNGPPALHTQKYARDVEETGRLGSADPALRTPDHDLIARWHIEMAQFQLCRVAREAVAARGLDLLTSARMFALLSVALNDGFISVFEAKYYFRFWRPITAIRNADDDGNDYSVGDPAWSPFLPVPPHPEYPAAHATIGASGITVLEQFLGQHYAFTVAEDVPQIPGVVVREFPDLGALLEDMGMARIYGGMHFRHSVEEGAKQGRKVAHWVLEHYLLPLD